MLGQPTHPQGFACLMQAILGEAVPLAQPDESRVAFLLLGTWDGAGLLPGGIGSHLPQASLSFRKHRVVELPPCLRVSSQTCRLSLVDGKGEFQQEGRRLFALLLLLVFLACLLLLAHTFACREIFRGN